jgi:hypothetical protein
MVPEVISICLGITNRTHPRVFFGRWSEVIVQADSFVVRTVYNSKECLCANCKVFACRRGLEEQLQRRHFHNEAAESSQDFVMGSHSSH